jgi:hypothetical protein
LRACLPAFACREPLVVIPRKRFDRCWWSLMGKRANLLGAAPASVGAWAGT